MRVLFGAGVVAVMALALGTALYFLAPGTLVDLLLAAQYRAAKLETETASIPDFEIRYLDNHGTGEPLLLVHGFGGTTDNWLAIAAPLGTRYRLIIPDLPGFGKSSAPPDADYSIESQVSRLHAFVSAVGLGRVHLGGNSMGGAIAAAFAARYPNQVASLWLVANAGVRDAPRTPLMEQLAAGELETLAPDTEAGYHQLLAKVTARPPEMPALFRDVFASRAVAVHPRRRQQLRDLLEEAWAAEDHLPGLPIPTHILWGREDQILHVAAVDRLEAMLPDASSTVMPGIGHVPMIEAPEATVADYLAFRERIALRDARTDLPAR